MEESGVVEGFQDFGEQEWVTRLIEFPGFGRVRDDGDSCPYLDGRKGRGVEERDGIRGGRS